MDYSVIRDDNIFGLRHDHDFRIAAFFIHPSGFDFKIEEEFLYQGRDFVVSDTTNVWTTNLFVRYELADKLGALSLGLTNLFDRRYDYLADPLALDPRVPRRQVRFQLEFFF